MIVRFNRCLTIKHVFVGIVKLDWGRSRGFRIGYKYGYIDLFYKRADRSNPIVEVCIPRRDASHSVII